MARRKGFTSSVFRVAKFIADPGKAMRPKSIKSRAVSFAKAINKTRQSFQELQESIDHDYATCARINARSLENKTAYEAIVRRKHGDSIYRIFYKKLVGVSFNNRKANICKLKEHQELQLVREPTNPVDPNAIVVTDIKGRDVGHLDARLAGEVSRSLAKGVNWHCYVRWILHTEGTDHYGAVVCLVKHKQEPNKGSTSRRKLQEHLSSPPAANTFSRPIQEVHLPKALSFLELTKKLFKPRTNLPPGA